jgi:hypothetical protein
MVEFTTVTDKADRKVIVYLMAAVLAVAGVILLFYVRYQQKNPPPTTSGPVVIEGMLRPGDPNFEYYKNKVLLENVKASLGINFAQSRIAIIEGNIANEGDRKLEALELHIALYDVYNKLSKERTATPLRPGVGLNKPMEPLEKRYFRVNIEPIEQLWDPKTLQIEITGLKYQ